jgi:hypothetical protein
MRGDSAATGHSVEDVSDTKQPIIILHSAEEGGCQLKDDPTFTKYFKMLRMRVPKHVVAIKMQTEGLDPAVLEMNPDGPASLVLPSASAHAASDIGAALRCELSKRGIIQRMQLIRPAVPHNRVDSRSDGSPQ